MKDERSGKWCAIIVQNQQGKLQVVMCWLNEYDVIACITGPNPRMMEERVRGLIDMDQVIVSVVPFPDFPKTITGKVLESLFTAQAASEEIQHLRTRFGKFGMHIAFIVTQFVLEKVRKGEVEMTLLPPAFPESDPKQKGEEES